MSDVKRLLIQFPADRDNDYYVRVWWVAETIRSQVASAGLGRMDGIDEARDLLCVDLADKHNVGAVKKIVNKLAANEFPGDPLTFTVVDVSRTA